MTNARTMGNVRTNTVRTSYNYRRKVNTGSGRTVKNRKTAKVGDGRIAPAESAAGRISRSTPAGSAAGRASRSTAAGRRDQYEAGTRSRATERPYSDLAERVYASGSRKKSARSVSRKTVEPVTKFSAAKRNTSNRAESRSGAGAAALAAGRTVTSPAREKAVSVRTKRNRTKALEVDRTYVMFLAVMCLLTVFVCVRYLQLKEIITTQTRTNTRLTAELDTLRNENDALLENVTNEIDLDHIRDVAINELGMKYATEDQIVWYTTEDREYVHQFEDVPAE